MARKEIVSCDRCGQEYDPYNPLDFSEGKEVEYSFQIKEFDDVYFSGLDLCSQCYRELVNWFERGKKSEQERKH